MFSQSLKYFSLLFTSYLLIASLSSDYSFAQQESEIKVLAVIAHPDDESGMAATIYKITHDLHGKVDIALVTNGEGGYKYSTLAEAYYNLELTREEIGREYLPAIRKRELMNAGKILGIRNYFFLDQKDHKYTLDVQEVFQKIWDTSFVKRRLREIIDRGKYDFVFTPLPTPETHGHHKGAAILALQAVSGMRNAHKPIVLGVSVTSKKDSVKKIFSELENFPITRINLHASPFIFDRTQSFGFKKRLNYKVIVNWEIAEHKSQGTMQLYMNEGDYENYWFYSLNDEKGVERAAHLFGQLKINTYPKLEYQE